MVVISTFSYFRQSRHELTTSVPHHHIMAAYIHGRSRPEELYVFLNGLQTQAHNADLQLVVVSKEVCFRNADNRRAHYGENPNDVRPYELASKVAYIGRQSGTLMMVANAPNPVWKQSRSFRSRAWTEERAAHRRSEADWHCFAMYFRMAKVSHLSLPSQPS